MTDEFTGHSIIGGRVLGVFCFMFEACFDKGVGGERREERVEHSRFRRSKVTD